MAILGQKALKSPKSAQNPDSRIIPGKLPENSPLIRGLLDPGVGTPRPKMTPREGPKVIIIATLVIGAT